MKRWVYILAKAVQESGIDPTTPQLIEFTCEVIKLAREGGHFPMVLAPPEKMEEAMGMLAIANAPFMGGMLEEETKPMNRTPHWMEEERRAWDMYASAAIVLMMECPQPCTTEQIAEYAGQVANDVLAVRRQVFDKES